MSDAPQSSTPQGSTPQGSTANGAPAGLSDSDIAALSFEQALEQLERIVAELESGQAPLERSIEIYERGARLKAHCESRLQAARLRVEKIVVGPGGEALRVEPAEFT